MSVPWVKKRRLGRPSTYAHIVQTLLERGYVREKGGRLVPTKRGIEVYRFLKENYPEYTSEELTRKLEEAMDRIERGELDYRNVLKEAYRIKEVLRKVGKVEVPRKFYYE
jgi:reverse gyrase